MADHETHLLTRFRAVDEDAARQVGDLLRGTAAGAASEQGHLSYEVLAVATDPTTLYVLEAWASGEDAQRHADLVLAGDGIDRVLPLLRERLDTETLIPLTSSTLSGKAGRAT